MGLIYDGFPSCFQALAQCPLTEGGERSPGIGSITELRVQWQSKALVTIIRRGWLRFYADENVNRGAVNAK